MRNEASEKVQALAIDGQFDSLFPLLRIADSEWKADEHRASTARLPIISKLVKADASIESSV